MDPLIRQQGGVDLHQEPSSPLQLFSVMRAESYVEGKPMLAAEVMRTSFATVKLNTPLVDVARLLLETNQRGLPVLDDEGRLAGIVTESDLLHREELGVSAPCNWLGALMGAEEGGRVRQRMRALRVAKIMTPDPLCVDEGATINEVVAQMDMREISQVPVVCADQVIGMISRFELVAALERCLGRSEAGAGVKP
jgi:CBS domain-containing protein